MAETFIDTNIFLYAAANQHASQDAGKHDIALALVRRGDFGMSAQVMQEFYVNAVRLEPVPLTRNEVLKWLELMAAMEFLASNQQLVFEGIAFAERYRVSYWDGAVLAAANALNVDTLFSEDLNHGQTYGSVRVVNPFKDLVN